MAWKCPDCSATNDSTAPKCHCGYAYYKILGVKPDTSANRVKQTYEYLIDAWSSADYSKDAQLRKKAEERLKQINLAYEIAKQCVPDITDAKKKTNVLKIAVPAGISVLVIVVALLSFSGKENAPSTQVQAKTDIKSPAVTEPKNKPVGPEPIREEAAPQTGGQQSAAPELREKTEEWAIEEVKNSYILDRLLNVETIMKKWTDENADKLKFIGWQVKKVDGQTYLVSYAASDGLTTKGFYFDVDINTGAVRHIANNPELQQKYGIKYGQ